MQRVLDCLTLEHDFRLTLAAVVVCAMGAGLSTRLFMRTHSINASRMIVQLCITAVIAGASIWATHFLAMLAYNPPVAHSYDLMRTALSLIVAILGIGIAFAVSKIGEGRLVVLTSGTLFGASIATMHYLGMWAYLVAGDVIFHPEYVAASIIGAAVLGCVMVHRLNYPVTRYCWVGAAAAMVLAVSAVHFIGMGALEIRPNPTIEIPDQPITDTVMGTIALTVILFLLLIGFGSFLIEMKIAEETQSLLRNAAMHDALTKLPNRAHLQAYLRERTDGQSPAFVVTTIDIDQFRSVNARMGNLTGDKLLLEFVARLSELKRPSDFIARAGSDEFVIVRSEVFHREDAHKFALTLLDCCQLPFESLEGAMDITVSIGTARCPDDASVPHDLLQKSQYAMKQAKSDPEQRISHYDAVMDQQSRDRDALVADLRHALINDELLLHFQRQNDIHSGAVVGFEVLCRWHHPVRGNVPPDVFIPLAEEIGLIKALGLWVLREACNEAVSWKVPFRIAVNVAPKQLDQPDFVELVDEILVTSGLAPTRLELEITEASIIDEKSNVLDMMHRLKKRGITIAMDDFGTGYSSLASLQKFPFDKIKIDRSFVQNVHKDVQRAAIVRSTLLLGAALDIPVLAEGIENQEELSFLRSENCDAAQGFFFGRPMGLEEARQITGYQSSLKKSA